MSTFIQFLILGIGAGAGYALLAQGLVVIQTGSGVINFAHGAFAMVAVFVFSELHTDNGWSTPTAFVFAVAFGALLAVLVYQVVMRPLRNAAPVVRVMATLGVMVLLDAAATLRWGGATRLEAQLLPFQPLNLGWGIAIGVDKLYLGGIALAITIALWLAYRYTLVGLAIRGAAENERAAAALGWSTNWAATLTWAIGGALAGVAGIFIGTQTALSVDALTLLVIPTLAAALGGGFVSFPMTLAAAMAIGAGQSLAANYIQLQGIAESIPFGIIILFLVVRGKTLPTRGAQSQERLPGLGTGKVSWRWLVVLSALVVVPALVVFDRNLINALTATVAWAIVLLALVVLMGYAGQVDLAPLAWGGIGAMVAAWLVNDLGIPFELALPIGAIGAIPVGILFGLPALRARGLNLAVVTLGLGVVLHAIVFSNPDITRGNPVTGIVVASQTIFGVDIGAFDHPERYFLVTFTIFVLLALLVASLRRGRIGRRLIAVRTNERAAASLGISVLGSKLFAFSCSSSIAAIGGILLGFQFNQVNLGLTFAPIQSINAATHAVLGGVGYIIGPLLGGQLAPGGLGTWLSEQIFPGLDFVWLFLIGGVAVILILLTDPDGLVAMNLKAARATEGQSKLIWLRPEPALLKLIAILRRQSWTPALLRMREPTKETFAPMPERVDVEVATLELSNLTVRYGGTTALDAVSLVVRPGELVGLIGPNGAGKTSLIDAVTGFTPIADGEVRLNGVPIDGLPAYRRAQLGVCRSFQNLELFESGTVHDNLLTAADPRDLRSYFTELIRPSQSALSPLMIAAVHHFGLVDALDTKAEDLSFGVRKRTAIARTVAIGPSVLLLDEPAAGLDDAQARELALTIKRIATAWGLGILLIEHNMAFVMGLCDRIAVLDFGHMIAQGTPAEIRSHPEVIAAYLGAPDTEVAA